MELNSLTKLILLQHKLIWKPQKFDFDIQHKLIWNLQKLDFDIQHKLIWYNVN